MAVTAVVSDLLRLALMIFSYTSENVDLTNASVEEGFMAESATPSTLSHVTVIRNIMPIIYGCTLPNERFNLLDEQCYEVMTRGPCKENQLFYEDTESKERGVCDCDSPLLLYSTKTDECYQQNSQGPCQDGEWFTLTDGISAPSCQPIPEGCLADGQHVFWSPDYEGSTGTETNDNKQCWLLGSQGPCSEGESLERFVTNYIGCQRISKVHRIVTDTIDSTDEEADKRAIGLSLRRSCGPGSRRTQAGTCRVIF